MTKIDIKLKTYEELQFEVIKLNTDIYLKDKEIERLSKEVDMWNRKYNEQFNIINELEKDIEEYFKKEYPDRKIENYNLKNCTYDYALVILGKLKELKEGKNETR